MSNRTLWVVEIELEPAPVPATEDGISTSLILALLAVSFTLLPPASGSVSAADVLAVVEDLLLDFVAFGVFELFFDTLPPSAVPSSGRVQEVSLVLEL